MILGNSCSCTESFDQFGDLMDIRGEDIHTVRDRSGLVLQMLLRTVYSFMDMDRALRTP